MSLVKTEKEIEIMRKGGKILAEMMETLKKAVKPKIKTKDLEKIAQKLIAKYKVKPSFLGFQGYPSCLCACVNEELVHCVPSERVLKEGDVLKLDFGICYQGYHLDMAVTLGVGKISFEAQRLIRVTKKALKLAIKKIKPGITLGDLGNTVQRYVESQGFNVIRDLCGHGIGKKLHEPPQIFNFGKRGKGLALQKGMVICVEPMVSAGDWKLERTKDGFGFKTKDNSLCAHFEHTVVVTEKGAEVLTKI